MSKPDLPKRFYTSVSVAEGDQGWAVLLDGRAIKTPDRKDLQLPSKALADAVAAEWVRQAERIDLPTMALTRLANVAIDRTPGTREAMADELASYASTDLVCYLAEGPAALIARQEAAWAPWRTWAGQTLNVVLLPVEGVIAAPQPQASLDAARVHALSLDDFRLTGLLWTCNLLGSCVLALACERGALPVPDAMKCALVDEDWQIEHWGEDAEAAAARAARQEDANALQIWFEGLAR